MGDLAEKKFDRFALRAIALDALVDEKSLKKFLRGEVVRPLTGERIRRAIAAYGSNAPTKEQVSAKYAAAFRLMVEFIRAHTSPQRDNSALSSTFDAIREFVNNNPESI